MRSVESAKHQSIMLKASNKFEGGIAWWRSADLTNGEFGEPVTIHSWGNVPEMD